jgi:tetratricopeptide (TPR) repeat protein
MTALMTIVLLAAAAAAPGFEAAYRAGLTALNKNDLATARTQLETAAKIQPNSAQVWLALAQTYFKQSHPDLADAAAGKAEAFGGNQPVVLHALAFYYAEARKPALAAAFEARYAERTPEDDDAFPRAIDLYLRAGEPKAAIGAANKAIKIDGSKPALHALLAKAYDSDGQFEKAIVEYRQVVALRPFDEGSYFELSQAFLRKQKFAEALAVLQDAHARFDKSAQIELATGVAFYALRRFPEAIDSFLRTIQLAPEVEQPYVFLGRMIDVAEAKMPDVSGAMATFASSQPKNYLSSFLYAKALAAQQADPSQTEPLLRKSIALNPNFWESHFEMGNALEHNSDFAGAAAEYEKSAALNPKDATTHYRLARVYDRLGKREQAAAQRALHAKLAEQEKALKPVLK